MVKQFTVPKKAKNPCFLKQNRGKFIIKAL